MQREKHFDATNTPIPFEWERLNIGNAMNGTSGIFTAPRAGTYAFFFNGVGDIQRGCNCLIGIAIYLNGNLIQHGEAEGMDGRFPQSQSFSLQSTLNSYVGDQIWLAVTYVSLTETFLEGALFSHFSGWLVEENLSQFLN